VATLVCLLERRDCEWTAVAVEIICSPHSTSVQTADNKKEFFLLNQKTFFPDNTESEAGEMKMWHHRF
jgi:hypothetical protein